MSSGKPDDDSAWESAQERCEDEVFIFPASFAQQRLWFIDQLAPGNSLYNVPLVFRLTGTLHQLALEHSFNQIVERHEILRTTFEVIDGELMQVVSAGLQLALQPVDLRPLPVAHREQEAIALIHQAMQQPFDLATGPLIRLGLWQLEDSDYLMLITLHHIIFDEWSSGILIRELGAVYSAVVEGRSPGLAALPIQYADFAHWQRQWLQGEVLEQQLSYWRQQLQELPPLNLPIETGAAAGATDRGAMQLLELPQSLLEALEELSQQAGATLFMTLLAGFQVLLQRYSGQADLVVGSPIANRNRQELEALIGFFVNSLVLRVDLAGDPTFLALLERVLQVTLAAYAHQDLPFEKLVEDLQPARRLGRHPLFQVVFALQNTPMERLDLPHLRLSAVEFETQTTRFDLEVYLWKSVGNFRTLWGTGWQQADGLRGVVVYNRELFTAEAIARLRQHFQTLLEAIVADPQRRISMLPMLTQPEQQQLQDWNATQTAYPADRCIQQLFEEQVGQTPAAIALQFADQVFTYAELNRGCNQLARYLQRLGVEPGTRVGLCLEQSPEAIAVMLAILKAGAAYVPLDPSHPAERLRFVQADAALSLVITQPAWASCFADGCPVLCLEQVWGAIAQERDTNLAAAGGDPLAYVIYTSGSTGTPKGVAVPHRAVVRLVRQTNYIQVQPGDRIAQVANLAFDAATFEIWAALLNGARLVGISRQIALAPLDFAAQLQQQRISVLFLTTALFNQIVSCCPDAFRSLNYLLFGGELVDPQQVRQVVLQGKPRHLLHVYGPTENTTFSSWYEVETVADTATTIPIGRAIANTQLYLLDADLNPVPIGVSGDLYLGGDGLAQGYLNQPALTAERFLSRVDGPDRASKLEALGATRLYRTGDRARYRPDGNLEFLGRRDHQIKLRGFRVELGEIEAVLGQHDAIQQAIVLLRPHQDNPQLVAYIVPQPDAVPSHRELHQFLSAKLPAYMLPVAFIPLERLPLTSNGKVDRPRVARLDRRALPTGPPASTGPVAVARTSTESQLESQLTLLWSRLLGQNVGLHDNFFELGGHSLLATQLISRVRDQLHVEVPLRCLFEAPTIAEFARQIAARRRPEASPMSTHVDIDRRSREEVEF